jgi:hypothetical protein
LLGEEMTIHIFSIDNDNVINSKFITAKTNYEFALQKLFPLIDKLDIQRNVQSPKFYQRLENDLINGCIMPPLTLAFIKEDVEINTIKDVDTFVNNNIQKAFVLDGIQRLNALNSSRRNNLDMSRPLFLNILICQSMDNLLYRMITLNNGQKPMTVRHQIEILANVFYEFDNLSITVQTEKERKKKIIKGSFRKSDIIKGYIAFLSNSTNIDNQKIIAEKMDELIADKIMDSNITNDDLEFSDITTLINKFSDDHFLLEWFKNNENNLIGFCVGVRKSYGTLKFESVEKFKKSIINFEDAFRDLNPAKLKVGQERRKLCDYFIANYQNLSDKDEMDLLNELSQVQ